MVFNGAERTGSAGRMSSGLLSSSAANKKNVTSSSFWPCVQHACLLQLQGSMNLQPCLDLSSYEKQAMFVWVWNVILLSTFTNTCHQFGSAWYLVIRRLVRALCCFDIVNVCPAIRTCIWPYLAWGVVGYAFAWSLNHSRRTRNLDGELRNFTAIIFLLVARLERGFGLTG